jgi:predicted permease
MFRFVQRLLGREPDENLSDELRFHLDMEAAKLERDGLSPSAARREARTKFGGVDRYTEELRDERRGSALDALVQDAKYALRITRRFPACTTIVVLTLGIAIGANTAIFSVVNAVLLAPSPLPNGDRLGLVYAQNAARNIPRFNVSYADFLDWRRDTRSFAGMSAYTTTSMTLLTESEPLRVSVLSATNDLFETLQARPLLGRLYRSTDGDAETANEIIVSYGFWQRQFAADPAIVGRAITIGANASARTVIGVLPDDFMIDGNPFDVVTVFDPRTIPGVESHGQHMLNAIARLKPGVSFAVAQQDLAGVAARIASQHQEIAGWSANVFSLEDEMVSGIRQPLLVLLAAAGLVLLIGSINVANLLITRATLREREVAMRQALGASRGRLVSQLLVESLELALAGAVLGLVVAKITVLAILRTAPVGLLPTEVPIDAKVLAFALGLTLVTTLVVGLWPALTATSPHLAPSLRDGGRSSTGGRRALRVRRSLVVAETSLALVLLICAGLVVQSLRHMLDVDPGFNADHVVTMRVSLQSPRYTDTTQVLFFQNLQTRLEGMAGIEASGAANTPPISGGGIATGVRPFGMERPATDLVSMAVTAVTPGYFRTMGMRLLQGRDVAWSDTRAVIVVSQSLANTFWPGQAALGKRIAFNPRDTMGLEVVGVVNDTHIRGLNESAPPMIYMHYMGATRIARSMSLVVRGRGDLASVVATTKQALHEVDATLPLFSPSSVSDMVDQSVGQPRLNSTLLMMFAAVALVLSAIGIYGVISYSVTQRTQEIGVRVALGAQQGDVLRLILREGATLAVAGVAIGVAGAFVATPLIRSWLFGIERSDAPTIVATSLGLVMIALLASYLPARRAARVDPLTAMRAD